MSEIGEAFADQKEYIRRLRARFGVPCPKCADDRPLTFPSKLLPQQRCRVDGYVDPRPVLTIEQKKLCRMSTIGGFK